MSLEKEASVDAQLFLVLFSISFFYMDNNIHIAIKRKFILWNSGLDIVYFAKGLLEKCRKRLTLWLNMLKNYALHS